MLAGTCVVPYQFAWGAPVPADATPPSGPSSNRSLRESEAAAERNRIQQQIASNIVRLKYCVAGKKGCAANDLPRLLLGLTRSEVEAILGPPQYQLRLASNHVFYWTVPLASDRPGGAVRVQVSFGDCYYREKESKQKAVCDAAVP